MSIKSPIRSSTAVLLVGGASAPQLFFSSRNLRVDTEEREKVVTGCVCVRMRAGAREPLASRNMPPGQAALAHSSSPEEAQQAEGSPSTHATCSQRFIIQQGSSKPALTGRSGAGRSSRWGTRPLAPGPCTWTECRQAYGVGRGGEGGTSRQCSAVSAVLHALGKQRCVSSACTAAPHALAPRGMCNAVQATPQAARLLLAPRGASTHAVRAVQAA